MKIPTVRFEFRLPNELNDALTKLRHAKRRTMTSLIIEAIEDYLRKHEPAEQERLDHAA